ncbi:SRPBCC domain-containing protein [Fibrella rubiginis]|uniref:SRPBCC domain-containing protein n=1 Tax=Fibrella rubiginis TaxID=2817060 RepID=UPI00286D7D7C|nr:SRPBCC domain-containing protein [Fibrella rubiginis]
MESKTTIQAQAGRQELRITRAFDLPVELLFKAHVEPRLVEQWMGTKVLRLDSKQHGSWQFETTDPAGNKHGFSGVIHEFVPNQKITRTFEMQNASAVKLPVQLEFLAFEPLTAHTSQLSIHIVSGQ